MRNFDKAKRIVIKIGTNTLSKSDRTDKLDSAYFGRIARQVSSLLSQDRQVLIISSGAIGMGAGEIKLSNKTKNIKIRQACAAIGQPLLMDEYRKSFAKYGITVAQVLVTAEVLNHRRTYLNLQNSIQTLLKLGVVPVINENDSVSTEEIGSAFGDNDRLSALVASKMDADLLIMLSDIDSLYDKDPRKNKNAESIPIVYEITDKIMQTAGGKGSSLAKGGMKTKLQAAKIASNAGCRLVLANGRARNIITRIIDGSQVGTLFMPKRKLSNRKRWILNNKPAGTITIDKGALKALKNRKSLLPSGIISVKGNFSADSVVMINDQAKAVTKLNSSQLKQVKGMHSSEIKKQFGKNYRSEPVIPEDIVFLDY